LEKSSQNKLINEIRPLVDSNFTNKFFAQINTAYKKAPYYAEVVEILKELFSVEHKNIGDLAIQSIIYVYKYLGKEINWTKSSILSPETKGMERADRLIEITKNLGYQHYVNAIGGEKLYDKKYFERHGISLSFVKSEKIEYKQFDNDFIPWLSIIDILMFNDKKAIQEQFSFYDY
jgi:hypothetical protein